MLINDDNIGFMFTCLEGAKEIAVDTETSGLNVRNNVDYMMGLCFSVGETYDPADSMDFYAPFRHKTNNISMRYLHSLVELLSRKDLIFHNRKFDMHSMATAGIDPLSFKGKQYDTLIIAHLVNEELYSKELDYLSKRYLKDGKSFGDEVHKMGKLFGYDNLTPEVVAPYGAKDAQLTRRLKAVLYPELVQQELESVYWETEAPFTDLLFAIEQRGVGVDRDFAHTKAEIGRGRMATISRTLGYNPASPIDLGKHLLAELDLPVLAHTSSCEKCAAGFSVSSHEGKASFNKVAMAEYDQILEASKNPTARLISEYRGWQKAVTSLYEPLLERTGPDGLIRTNFKQHGTVTGRLSAEQPNLQQVPRGSDKPWNGNAKSAFTSGREGLILIGWDYSQLELRLAAAYGMESILLTEFEREQADPFSVLAPLIFGVLTPETRHETKTFVYANLYGAGPAKIAWQLGRTLEETKPLYANYKQSIQGITKISQQVAKAVEQRGYIKYFDGRRRHIKNKNDSYKAWNSVCQGGGAQLVKKAMLRCKEFESDECQMVLQVHDEITFIMPPDKVSYYEPLIKHAMTDWPVFGVNLAVEGKQWK